MNTKAALTLLTLIITHASIAQAEEMIRIAEESLPTTPIIIPETQDAFWTYTLINSYTTSSATFTVNVKNPNSNAAKITVLTKAQNAPACPYSNGKFTIGANSRCNFTLQFHGNNAFITPINDVIIEIPYQSGGRYPLYVNDDTSYRVDANWFYVNGPQPTYLPTPTSSVPACNPQTPNCSTSQHSLAVLTNGNLFAATDKDNSLTIPPNSSVYGGAFVFDGSNWSNDTGNLNSSGASDVALINGLVFLSIKQSGSSPYFASGGIYYADESNLSGWTNIFDPQPGNVNNSFMQAVATVNNGSNTIVYAGTNYNNSTPAKQSSSGLLKYSYPTSTPPTSPQSWAVILPNTDTGVKQIDVRDIYIHQNENLLVGTQGSSPYLGGIWRSTVDINNTETWEQTLTLSTPTAGIRTITGIENNPNCPLFAGAYDDNGGNFNTYGAVYMSKDNGKKWQNITQNDPLIDGLQPDIFILTMAELPTRMGCDYVLFAGTRDQGVFQWTETTGWAPYNFGFGTNDNIRSLIVKQTLSSYNLYAGLVRGGVWQADIQY